MTQNIISTLSEHWGELLKASQEMTFSKGQVLFYEGHYPYGLFVLLSGDISFSKNGQPCGESHLWKSPKGEVIGVESLVGESPSCCTSMAERDSTVVFIPKSRILAVIGEAPHSLGD